MIGVPITFMDKYSPEQFEIVGIAKTWFEKCEPLKTKEYSKQIQVSKSGKRSEVSKLNDGAVVCVDVPPTDKTYYIVDGKYYVQEYARILIRRKHQWT